MNDCFMLKLTSSGPFKKISCPKHVWMGGGIFCFTGTDRITSYNPFRWCCFISTGNWYQVIN